MPEQTDLVEVRTTAPDAGSAALLARALVEGGLAACVQVVPGVTSTYVWQGEVEVEDEHLLLVKSTASRVESIRTLLRSEHPYETPEVLAVPVVWADPAYAAWVRDTVADDAPPGTVRAKDER
ncbi:divalent-cation tolerance protein CutA [Oryzobacter telluris]|uniref:divalent-cation tolerance protein CutA n=1 Tax=Oryzobacter telluris TaxID=3149179 RepID=UPI00370DA7D7